MQPAAAVAVAAAGGLVMELVLELEWVVKQALYNFFCLDSSRRLPGWCHS